VTSDEQKKPAGTTAAKSYRDLLVWQKGIAVVKLVYEVTKDLPAEERFGLTSQMRF